MKGFRQERSSHAEWGKIARIYKIWYNRKMEKTKLLILGEDLVKKMKSFYLEKTKKTKSLLHSAEELQEKVDSFEQMQEKLSNI